MSTRKTIITKELVLQFLLNNFSSSISDLKMLDGGEMSCPFSFTAENVNYVIRIDPYGHSYKKDAYAWKNFASEKLPIPEMVQLGKFDNKNYFAITKKAKGKTLVELTKEETLQLMPAFIDTLETIHAIDVSQTKGYGSWNPEGKATYKSWREYLLSINEDIEEWKKHNKKSYFDPSILEKLYNTFQQYLEFVPEEKYLLHGDYGFSNVVTDGKNITGVLDWGEARYGDFIFDIAWLDLWQEDFKYEEIFRNYYESINEYIPHFSERITCYKLYHAYDALKFMVASDQREKYSYLELKANSLLDS